MSNVSLSFYVSKENAAYIREQVKKKNVKRYNKSNWLDDLIDHLRNKSESRAPAVKKEITLPEGLNLYAWGLWIDYRKQIKKPLKTASQAKNLIKLGETQEGQLAVVMQSIDNEYQGLFGVKGNETNKQATNDSGLSASRQAVLEARRQRDSQESRSPVGLNDGVVHGQVDQEEWGGRIIDMDGSDS